jgi:hypothetical protein
MGKLLLSKMGLSFSKTTCKITLSYFLSLLCLWAIQSLAFTCISIFPTKISLSILIFALKKSGPASLFKVPIEIISTSLELLKIKLFFNKILLFI